MKKNNFNIFIVDAGKVVHLEGMSSNWPTEELSKLYHLSSIYFFRKHFREFEVNIIVGFWFLGLLCKIFLDIFFLKCIFFGRSLLEERLLFNIIGIKVILKGFFLRKNYESSLKLDSYNLKTNIEVIIPVRNEEKKIEDCIKSVLWTDRIFIIDSKSIDKTVEISKKYTNDIFTHDFEYSAKQKNWALETLPINSEWVLLIDADERISNKLKREILCTVSKKSTKYSAYTIPRSNYVGNIKIKNGGWHPDRNVRLIKHNSGKFEDRPVHAEFEVIGKTGKLYSPIIHFTRESTIEHLYHMVCYSKIEAKWIYYHGECILEPGFIWFPKHFRKILRKFFKILPQKSVLRFLWYFVFRRGFLDGTRAMILQMIELFYRIWLELYLIEIKQKERSSYNVEIE
jgi:glycosyltransferase involved in cell wall biosynthesis